MSARARVGYMSQSFSLYTELTVRQNLHLHARLFHLPRDKPRYGSTTLVEQFGLSDYLDQAPPICHLASGSACRSRSRSSMSRRC